MAVLTRGYSFGGHTGDRDRGRGRRRERVPGRIRSSRSRSPKNKSPSGRFRRNGAGHETFVLSACPVCLSRRKHNIRACQLPTLWDGKHKARCTRSDNGRVLDEDGRALCYNWNQSAGCEDKSARHIHECSGCGESSHGAQECGLAQKAPSENPTQL